MIRFIAAALLLTATQSKAEDSRDIRLIEIKGNVWIKEPQGDWQLIPEGSVSVPIEEGESIKTGGNSEATLQMDQLNTIELDAYTEFEVSATQMGWTKFRLSIGRILAKIEEKLVQNQRRMTFTTNQAVLAVRGTEFAVEASEIFTKPAIPERTPSRKDGGIAVFEGEVEAEFPQVQNQTVRIGTDQEIDLNFKNELPQVRALKRFASYKKRMALFRKKHAHLRGQWRKISMERRKAIRSKIQKRMKQRVEQKRQTRIRPDAPRPNAQERRQERRQNRRRP